MWREKIHLQFKGKQLFLFLGSIPGRIIPKTQKMVLDPSLLNTQHHKVRIKGKIEQSKERSITLPYTFMILFFTSFLHLHWLVVFHWNLSVSKSLQVSRTLPSILTNFNKAVVWIVSILHLISSSSSLFSKPLKSFQVHQLQLVSLSLSCSLDFFSSLVWSKDLSIFSFDYFHTVARIS